MTTVDRSRARLAPLRGYRPDVQALRGLAVLLVVLYHARIVTPGGFIGVDVFFVISGFVIGRRLVERFAGEPRMMRGFYVHRAHRILPALGATLVIVILTAPLLAPIGGVAKTSPTGIAAALFSANAYLYKASGIGYFAPAAELNPLLHTWSLSVEEQFYFVIPALLFVAWRVGRRRGTSVRALRWMVGLFTAASFALCVALSESSGTVYRVDGLRFAFFSPFTRAWEFGAGLVLVLLPVRLLAGPRTRIVLLTAGVAMIGIAALTYSDSMVFPGYAALLPVIGAAFVVHAGTRAGATETPPVTSPALRPMTWMGDLSYSWYLWHWPLIVYAAAFWPGGGRLPLVVAAVVSLLPAWWSYRALEQRLRTPPRSGVRPTVVLVICCIAAPLVAAAVALPIRTLVNRATVDKLAFLDDTTGDQPGDRDACNNPTPLGSRSDGCAWGARTSPTSVVLFGDSNAAHFSEAVIGAANATGSRLEIADLYACPIADVRFEPDPAAPPATSPDACHDFVEGSIDALVANPPDVVVIAVSTDVYVFRSPLSMADPNGGEMTSDRAAKAQLFEDGLVRMARRLRDAGSRVVFVDVAPKPYSFDPTNCSRLAVLVDATRCLVADFTVDSRTDVAAANALQARAAERAGAQTWSFAAEICPEGRCTPVRDGRLVWRDPEHISAATSRSLVPAATASLRAALDEPAPQPD